MTDSPRRGLYTRVAELVVGTVKIPFDGVDGLRIAFKIEKNPKTTEPNHCAIEIFNLNKDSRDAISTGLNPTFVGPQHPGLTTVTLSAGYASSVAGVGAMGAIHVGHTHSIVHARNKADWSTKILSMDGLLSNEIRLAQTLKGKQTLGAVVGSLVKQMKEKVSTLDTTQVQERLKSGDFQGAFDSFTKAVSFSGLGMAQLDRLLKPAGYELTEQDGKLILLGTKETLKGEAILLSSDTGLIGTIDPIVDDKRPQDFIVKARCLLNHEIEIGSGIVIDSEVFDHKGLFKVRKLEHHGDTHGSEWLTEFEAVEVQQA